MSKRLQQLERLREVLYSFGWRGDITTGDFPILSLDRVEVPGEGAMELCIIPQADGNYIILDTLPADEALGVVGRGPKDMTYDDVVRYFTDPQYDHTQHRET